MPQPGMSRAARALQAVMAENTDTQTRPIRTLVLGGGCFWCLDALYREVRGVTEVTSGYTGGRTPRPTYESVCSGRTGHAEAVRVSFDESVVPASVILDMFFAMHDPTTLNRQGYDVGTQYRSAVFAASERDAEDFEAARERAAGLWEDPIVTALEPLGPFFEAEAVHQNYYAEFPDAGYCQVIVNPKLSKARRAFEDWIRPQPA